VLKELQEKYQKFVILLKELPMMMIHVLSVIDLGV
jgi:hypothetical protein